MKKCRYCGTENDDNDNFCLNCGKSLSEYVNNYSSMNRSSSFKRKFVDFMREISLSLCGIFCILGAPFFYCALVDFHVLRNSHSCETIMDQIFDILTYPNSLGIGFIIGVTFYNICLSQDIRRQLKKIKDELGDKSN